MVRLNKPHKKGNEMKKLVGILFVMLVATNSSNASALTMDMAISILKENNLEIKIAKLDQSVAKKDENFANGNHYGKLSFLQDIAYSDDAGNVFGFKLTAREASLGDLGMVDNDVLQAQGALQQAAPGTAEQAQAQNNLGNTEPDSLNYPDARAFFQSKIRYEVPFFTGYKLTNYVDIMKSMTKMKTLDKHKVINEKIYEVRKSFYDMALLKNSTKNLKNILNNIHKLENMTQSMIDVGYAKKVDLLEVRAKKGNVERLLMDLKLNQKLLYHYISFLLNKKVTSIVTPKSAVPMPRINSKEILENNVDIKRALVGLKIRKNMLGVNKSANYPMIGAFAEVATADDTFLGDAGDHAAYSLGMRLSWNLYNGGIDKASIEKAKIELIKTKTQVQLARKGIGLKIAKIRTEIKSSNEKVIFLEKELALANEIYNNYEGRYREKLSSMSDVIIKQSQQIEKILELQMVKNTRNERIFALEKLANGDL